MFIGRITLSVLFSLLMTARIGVTQTIAGVVREAGSERGIQNAAVVLIGPNSDEEFAVLTSAAGVFRLTAPAAGEYRLRVEASGYTTFEVEAFPLAPADALRLDIRLELAPIELPEVVARGLNANRAGFERRRQLSYGTRIGPAELAERGTMPLSEFVAERAPWASWRHFEGLYTRSPFQFGSTCVQNEIMLFIDLEYFRLAAGIPMDLDRWVPVERVRAIEVYPDGTAVPSPFFGLARSRNKGVAPCAVVVVWTTDGFGEHPN